MHEKLPLLPCTGSPSACMEPLYHVWRDACCYLLQISSILACATSPLQAQGLRRQPDLKDAQACRALQVHRFPNIKLEVRVRSCRAFLNQPRWSSCSFLPSKEPPRWAGRLATVAAESADVAPAVARAVASRVAYGS